ncbi:MAG: hypothetical protein WCK14_02095 [Actinomycetota bacterium]|jgi:hypothetical protein
MTSVSNPMQATKRLRAFGAPRSIYDSSDSLRLAVDFDNRAVLNKQNNALTVTGTFTCADPDFGLAFVNVSAMQLVDGRYLVGLDKQLPDTDTGLECDGTPQRFSKTFVATHGRFIAGQAVLDGDIKLRPADGSSLFSGFAAVPLRVELRITTRSRWF